MHAAVPGTKPRVSARLGDEWVSSLRCMHCMRTFLPERRSCEVVRGCGTARRDRYSYTRSDATKLSANNQQGGARPRGRAGLVLAETKNDASRAFSRRLR